MGFTKFQTIAFISVFLCGLIPSLCGWVFKAERFMKYISIASVFASGVFFAAGIIHLLGDSGESLEGVVDYPLAQLLCCSGFLAMLVLETCVEKLFMSHKRQMEKEEILNSTRLGASAAAVDPEGEDFMKASFQSPLSAVLLCVALVSHSFFEGFPIGAENNTKAQGIFGAVIAHKAIAAFVLGSSLAAAVSKIWFVLLCILFAVASPIGIIVGATMTVSETGKGLIIGVCSGIFVYVSLIELLCKHLIQRDDNKLIKLFLFTLGFSMMAIVAIWT